MYQKARLKLTIIYSTIFISLFVLFSIALYIWFNSTLGEGYITEVGRRYSLSPTSGEFTPEKRDITITSSIVALEQLRDILISSNVIVLFISPLFAWFLTSKTLSPIENAVETQKRFVSDASHELRTPLSIIQGEMDVTLKRKRTVGYYKNIIESTKEEIERLSSMVSSLLFLSRADNGGKNINFTDVDITDILAKLAASYSPKIKEKDLKFKFVPPKVTTTIKGDEEMLSAAISNLLDNAIKYTPRGGKIWLKAKNERNFVTVTIKDTGIGIAAEDMAKIFNRFYRIENSAKEKGFGLGLSLVKSVTDSHKIKVIVSSKPNKGSTFTLFIPKTRTTK